MLLTHFFAKFSLGPLTPYDSKTATLCHFPYTCGQIVQFPKKNRVVSQPSAEIRFRANFAPNVSSTFRRTTRNILSGATDWDRTSNLRLRRPTLYPIELQSHLKKRANDLISLAEGGGFEPPVRVYPVRRFSKPLPSATQPSLLRVFMRKCFVVYQIFWTPSTKTATGFQFFLLMTTRSAV